MKRVVKRMAKMYAGSLRTGGAPQVFKLTVALAMTAFGSLVAALGPRRVECPCCGWHGARFLPFLAVTGPVFDVRCPRCDSKERHRGLVKAGRIVRRFTHRIEASSGRLGPSLALGSSAPRYELTVTRLHLAQALLAVGDGPSLAEARRVATEVAEAEARIAPGEERSPHEVLPAFVLARVDLAEGNLADARRGFEEALALWQRAGRGSSAASGEAHLLLGETLLRLGERTAAEAELRAAYELLFRRSGANHADTLRAKARLDELKSGPGTGRQPAAQLPPAGRR